MDDDILNTINLLTARIKTKEDEANKLKGLVNELCGEAGVQIRYPDISASGGISSIRADQFYGLPLTTAIRNYLEIRKANGLGAATVVDVYRAVRDGGYKFDTKNDDNARIGVGNALRKTSAIFHRLPNGQYGLLSWYPSARAPSGTDEAKRAKPRRGKTAKKEAPKPKTDEKLAVAVTNEEVRDFILGQTGEFTGADIAKALKAAMPTKKIPPTKVPTVIFILRNKGLLKIVKERDGKKGATFTKV